MTLLLLLLLLLLLYTNTNSNVSIVVDWCVGRGRCRLSFMGQFVTEWGSVPTNW